MTGRARATVLLVMALPGLLAGCGCLPMAEAKKQPVTAILQERAEGRGVLPAGTAPDIEQRLQSTLDRIVAVDGGKIRPQLFLTPSSAPEIYSRREGAIFVSLGLVGAVRSDDELAFLLAHEYAHLNRQHHAIGAQLRRNENLKNIAGLLVVIAVASGDASMGDLFKTLLATGAVAEARRALSIPDWSRQQETEADMDALRFVARAGFNADGAFDFFDRVLDQQATDWHVPPQLQTGRRQPNTLGEYLVQQLADAWREFAATKSSSHPATLERKAAVGQLVDAEFPTHAWPQSTATIVALADSPRYLTLMRQVGNMEAIERATLDGKLRPAALKAIPNDEIGRSGWGMFVIAQAHRKLRTDMHAAAMQAAATHPEALLQARLASSELEYFSLLRSRRGTLSDFVSVKDELHQTYAAFGGSHFVLPYMARIEYAMNQAVRKDLPPEATWSDVGQSMKQMGRSLCAKPLQQQLICLSSTTGSTLSDMCGNPLWLEGKVRTPST